MTEEEIKINFSHNLLRLRKAKNLTQTKLAEALNYSDKAVSKWEVGAVLPDVETMVRIADFFDVKINDLIYSKKRNIDKSFKLKNLLISLLSVVGVWFAALVVFYICINVVQNDRLWIIFIGAIPVSFILAIIFSSLWFNRFWVFVSISGFVWSAIGTIYVILNSPAYWFIFIIGVVAQVLVTLSCFLGKLVSRK